MRGRTDRLPSHAQVSGPPDGTGDGSVGGTGYLQTCRHQGAHDRWNSQVVSSFLKSKEEDTLTALGHLPSPGATSPPPGHRSRIPRDVRCA